MKIKTYLKRKLFIILGFDKMLIWAYEYGVINSKQLHFLDEVLKNNNPKFNYQKLSDYAKTVNKYRETI